MASIVRHLLLIASCALGVARIAAAEPPPAEAFFRHPDFEEAKLAPSGRWLAISAAGGATRVGLIAIDLQDIEKPRRIVSFNDTDVLDFNWVNDDRLVFRIVDRNSGGDRRFGAGLYSVRRDGTELRQLIELRTESVVRRDSVAAQLIGREPLDDLHVPLAYPAGGGSEIIVGEYRVGAGRDVRDILPKRLDVATLRTTTLALGAPPNALYWLFDPFGEPRVVESVREGQTVVYWRGPKQEEWTRIAAFPTLNAEFTPRFVDAGGVLYVTVGAGGAGYRELRRFDFAARRVESNAVVRTPGFDFNGRFVVDPTSARVLGVRVETDAQTTHWFDPRLARMQQMVDAKFPGRINRVSCARCGSDDIVLLVNSWSDHDPGWLWTYRAATDQWQAIGRARKDIDPAQMANLDFHRFRARDGLEIPVWVTMKQSPAPREPSAAVVLVHGGPWVRGGHWRWNNMAQFLASRGYVVIEPEFRGSSGYGRAHHVAGRKQWGRAMQDDLADAVQWAAGKGWIDPKRVCIAGASYGGYAALMGPVRNPGVYRCAAAWSAVTDPRLLFRWNWSSDMVEEVRLFQLPTLIGDPEADAKALAEVAPVEQAARIRAPVLLAHGGEDLRVPLAHGTRMRDALRAAGREPQWVLYPDEGHTWLKAETHIDFARRLERFLAEHLR